MTIKGDGVTCRRGSGGPNLTIRCDYITIEGITFAEMSVGMAYDPRHPNQGHACHITLRRVHIYGNQHGVINGHCLAGAIADSYLRIEDSVLGPSPSHNVYCSGAAWCVMLRNVFLGKALSNDAKTHMLHSTSRGNVIEDNLFLGHASRTPLAYATDFPGCSHTSLRRNVVVFQDGAKVVAVGAYGARPNALYRVPDCDNDQNYAEVYIEDNVFINFNAPDGSLEQDKVAPYKNAQAGWHVRLRLCPESEVLCNKTEASDRFYDTVLHAARNLICGFQRPFIDSRPDLPSVVITDDRVLPLDAPECSAWLARLPLEADGLAAFAWWRDNRIGSGSE